jgi:hypothetical protein
MSSIESSCNFATTMKQGAARACQAARRLAGSCGVGYASAVAAILLAFAADAADAAGLTELPNGPNRELVAKACQSCHDLQMLFDAAGNSREEWSRSLDEMTTNGMSISADERTKILDYLSTYLGPSQSPP